MCGYECIQLQDIVSVNCPAISKLTSRMMLSSALPKLRKLTLPYQTLPSEKGGSVTPPERGADYASNNNGQYLRIYGND